MLGANSGHVRRALDVRTGLLELLQPLEEMGEELGRPRWPALGVRELGSRQEPLDGRLLAPSELQLGLVRALRRRALRSRALELVVELAGLGGLR